MKRETYSFNFAVCKSLTKSRICSTFAAAAAINIMMTMVVELNQFAINFRLNQTVNIIVSCVVLDTTRFQFKSFYVSIAKST